MGRWYRKVRRRKGGVYVWRVDHHLNRARRVTGYVGETVSYHFRSRQHLGTSHFVSGDVRRHPSAQKIIQQSWADLNPRMYKVIPLPWWLCWKWVLRPLETLVILATWPVYNDAKNRWNPRRVSRRQAAMDRARRDAGLGPSRARIMAMHTVRAIFVSAVWVMAVCAVVMVWKAQ